MQFVDKCSIFLKAGNGGNGVCSWRHEKHVQYGGPDGGNGGKGGDIIIIGDHNEDSLFELRNTKKVVAENGKNGIGGNLFGKNAEDLFIHVPIGCSVYDSQTNELLADIIEDGQTYTVCHGGMGGHGNTFFKSSFNRIPTLYENGELGEERNVVISLKFFADVGLVGLPNAGKSTLISQISNANPKIANYQFTTLNPVLGIVKHNNMQLVFEDIPGLIEGANTGKGLGHDFLKHVERCHILLHLISLSEFDNENPYEAYETINNELQLYSKDLVQKEILVVGNKIDTPNAQEALKSLEKKLGKKIFAISALEKINTTELVNYIFDKYAGIIKELRENQITKMREIKYEGRLQERKLPQDTTVIKNSDGEYVVVSEYVDYWANRIPLTTPDNIIRFNQKLQTSQAEEKAKQLGAKRGDTLVVAGTKFTID